MKPYSGVVGDVVFRLRQTRVWMNLGRMVGSSIMISLTSCVSASERGPLSARSISRVTNSPTRSRIRGIPFLMAVGNNYKLQSNIS